MTEEKTENVVKKPRNNDETFVVCYQKHAGNVMETAKELNVKENTVRMRALKYIAAGVKLTPPKRKERKLQNRIEKLNNLIS